MGRHGMTRRGEKPMHIVFICTGNTCRSPMAEQLFRMKLWERGREDISCRSAGLCAENGQPATVHSIEACKEIGVDLTGHRSKLLDALEAEEVDLFVVMTGDHAAILRSVGISGKKIMILGEGIPDPYGWDIDVYRMCRDTISAGLDALLDRLEESE